MGLSYRLSDEDDRPTPLGLIVLQTDETIEAEFQRLFAGCDVSLMVSRVPSDPVVNTDSLRAMQPRLTKAASLLPPTIDFAAVGYGCTSGATVIGPEQVAKLVGQGCSTKAVTNPLSAVIAACEALNVRRLGFITPYAPAVSEAMRAALVSAGLDIAEFASFEEDREEMVARIDGPSIINAVRGLRTADCDGVFLSCTNLNTANIVAPLEAEIGRPVISSNLALAWHMARLGKAPMPDASWGQLFRA